jgi:catalase
MDPAKYIGRDIFDGKHSSTLAGAPVADTMNSLTAGERGPVLLEDFHMVEKLANFSRERIPERVVHARGVTTKGTFSCTSDALRDVTAAAFLTKPGSVTDVAVRFSTVVHSRHSPETLRDPRGFAVKFYTSEGNWDLVGNNMPVFFIRDGIAFPDMVHAFKPNPRTDKQEFARIFDFLSFHPESCHMLTFLLDDVGIPASYSEMEGFGVHTYTFVTSAGKRTYVKFHWVPEQPVKSIITDEEAVRVGGADFSHATHALIDSIDAGKFPAWNLHVQLMDPATEKSQPWGDPLDATKTWPEDQFPLIKVGRMELNKTVDNLFLENEQIAFSPGVIVPGITYSADKLLQGRLFSYADTQRYRLGSNYQQLPINAPRCPFQNNHFDGTLNTMHRTSEINYFPSSRGGPRHAPHSVPIPKDDVIDAPRTRRTIPNENNFQQAGERFMSWDEGRQQRFVERVADALNEPGVTKRIRTTWLGYWSQSNQSLGSRIAARVKMNSL